MKMQRKKYSSVERLFSYVFKDFHIIITSLNKILLLINDSTISGCVLTTSYKSGSYPGGYFPRYRCLPGRPCRTRYPGYPYPGACRPGHPGCPYCYRYPYKSGLLFSMQACIWHCREHTIWSCSERDPVIIIIINYSNQMQWIFWWGSFKEWLYHCVWTKIGGS